MTLLMEWLPMAKAMEDGYALTETEQQITALEAEKAVLSASSTKNFQRRMRHSKRTVKSLKRT